jgi:hypothetical protein
MQEYVAQFIRGYILCCTNKISNKNQGLYHPLAIPRRTLDNISMDFVGGLPKNRKGHDYLFVVVYRINKMSIFMHCKSTIKGQ